MYDSINKTINEGITQRLFFLNVLIDTFGTNLFSYMSI